MKRVSCNVAKALKEAGYKFTPAPSSFFTNETNSWFDNEDGELYSLPFAFEVWLWLWREKGIEIEILNDGVGLISQIRMQGRPQFFNKDPEEAIKSAIEYICENNLIK